MAGIFNVVFYVFTFLAVYVEIFFLYTFLEQRKEIVIKLDDRPDRVYPGVTVVVPCWNEENTVLGTVNSLLGLDYPKDKLHLILVDDGSTDRTWEVLQNFSSVPNIQLIRKENGGKHTAMNLGIERATTEFIGCLDADSAVTPSALKRMIPYFDDATVMAVSPSIIVNKPKKLIQWAQKVEYHLSVYNKKMLGLMNGIHVTPGPFSIYRMDVFRKIGPYRLAHKTEDMEIAFRMHEHHMRIEQCHDAHVYTNTPSTPYALYRQRRRWIYGFVNNTLDYRRLIFKNDLGAFAFFTIPAGVVSIFSAVYLFIFMIYSLGNFISVKVVQAQAVGLQFSSLVPKGKLDLFFINTHAVFLITILLYGLVFISLMIGTKMATGKARPTFTMIWYLVVYSLLAPIWLMAALYNTVMRRETAWR